MKCVILMDRHRFREPAGGMRCARKSSNCCSDASVLNGPSAGAQDVITMQYAP